ncbi:MAG: S8 family serine peptidase [Alphaproteobacteria bacterium]|nr:S8 family serine peptidase [Alphaproteobacteria bacterium]
MFYKKLFLLAFLFFATIGIAVADPDTNQGKGLALGNQEPTEILVKFVQNVGKGQVPELSDATEVGSIPQIGVKILKVKNPKAIAKLLEHNKHVVYAEPNFIMHFNIIPNDPQWKSQSAALNIINAPAGWDITTGVGSPIIAIVDSGVASGHTDLPLLLPGYAAVSGLSPNNDKVGHGTGVAGTAGMIGNNGIGGAGINWNAQILPVKIDDANGTITVANVAKGVIWASDNNAKVMNLSLGTTSDSVTLKNSIDYAYNKGVAIFAATGNDGKNSIDWPARYPNVIAVGSTGNGTTRYSSSNYGPGMDVVAISSYYTTTAAGGWLNMAGTSFASPQAAGLASLVFAVWPSATPAQVYDVIRDGATTLGGGYNQETGYGLINMSATLTLAVQRASSGNNIIWPDSAFENMFSGCTSLSGPSAKSSGQFLYQIAPALVTGAYTGATGLSDYNQIPASWGGGGM